MKKHLHLLLGGLTLLLLSSCFGGGGGGGIFDPAEVRRQVSENAQQIAVDITSEDVFQASLLVHDSFELQPEVAQKFDVGPFEGKGQAAFRSFFERVVEKYGDLELILDVNSVDVEGNLATAHVTVTFSGNNTDAVPPAELNFTEEDLLVFEWNGQEFALINWGEDPAHNQGGGGS